MNSILYLLVFCLAFVSCGTQKPELHIYCWANFFADPLIIEFEKRHDCRVVIDTYDSNESLFAKLRLGAAGYDLIVPSNYFVEFMRDEAMLEPINASAITNRSYVDQAIDAILDPALSQYGVPYMVTYTGIGWRNDRLHISDPSWNIFADKSFRGRMTMLNDPRETIGIGLLYHGFSVNTLDQNELEIAKKTILGWKKNLAKFENEQYKNGIASGEYLVVHGYSGDIVQVMHDDARVSFAAPKEGITATVDFLCIPTGAKNKDLAHAFINYLYETDTSLQNTIYTGLLVPNKHIYNKLPLLIQNIYAPFLQPSRMKQIQFIRYLGEDTQIYNRIWDDIKATRIK